MEKCERGEEKQCSTGDLYYLWAGTDALWTRVLELVNISD
jgi:uncharacterized cupin superfamily protein